MGSLSKRQRDEERYRRTKGLCAYDYEPSEKERRARDFCMENDIRISPIPVDQGSRPDKWYVGISTPDNYKKVYKSKFQFNNEQIWEEIYKACIYYYDKC